MSETEIMELRLDEDNELFFRLGIQGATERPQLVRLTCEGGSFIYSAAGEDAEEGVTRFVIRRPGHVFEANRVYEGKLEVVVENRYFVPAKFKFKFKEPVRVVAESLVAPKPEEKPAPTKIVSPEKPKQASIQFDVKPVERPSFAGGLLRKSYESSKGK